MKTKTILVIVAEAFIIGIAFYTDFIRLFPVWMQLLLFLGLASLHLLAEYIFDYTKERAINWRLEREKEDLKLETTKTKKELSDLQKVVVSFLEYSEIYRQKVKDHLNLNEDFLCIAKSSEGLSDVFNEMDERTMLPFGKVLSQIPGSIKPFENMAVFLIPVRSLPGISEKNIRKYIDKKIIPAVEKERKRFLDVLPKKLSVKAEDLSFKYIAFLIRRDVIAYDTLNRKFNREFNAFIVLEQSGKNLERMKTSLEEVVKTKDILMLVDWSSFTKLNNEQSKLIADNKQRIYDELSKSGITTLSDISTKSNDEFFNALWPAIKRKTTKRKAEHLAKKVVEGTKTTVDILRKNGVNI